MSEHPYVLKLNKEIKTTISQIMEGKNLPTLKIALDDSKLENNPQLFVQIVAKHLAVERYDCYTEVHKMLNQFKSEINAQEILQIQNQINLRQIYISVFKLFGLKWKYDPDLSVTKIYAYYQNNNDLQKLIKDL